MRQIYLDHNATTWLEQGARRALLLHSFSPGLDPESPAHFGNASSVHALGRSAKAAVENARESIAAALGLQDPDALLFTASATEATNTALKGFYFHHRREGRPVHFFTSAGEHEATLETIRFLCELGARATILPLGENGELSLASLEAALAVPASGEARLVSLMAANNETGVVFPWREAAALAHKYDVIFHLDGVQAWGKLPGFTLADAPVPLASFSAHKIGGPKGMGLLVVQRGTMLESLVHGGTQERRRRAGTLNVAGIAAFGAAAAALAERDLTSLDQRRAWLEAQVKARIPGTLVIGEGAARLVNTSSFLFEGVRGEGLVMGLDLDGFAVSSGSACNSGSVQPSHVLLAMGFDKVAAQSAVRVSLAPETSEEELGLFVSALTRVVERIRSLGRKG